MAHWSDIPLLTTAAGSYPPGDLPPKRAIQQAVEDQIAAGIDLISDGQVRADIISLFAGGIPGFRQARDGVWELVAPPDVPGEPLVAADYLLARLLAKGRATVKGVITGPITLALSTRLVPGTPYDGNSDPHLILRLADILGREAAALVAAGAEIVQIDEPMLPEAIQNGLEIELAEQALRDVTAIIPFSILHICADVRPIAYELLTMPVNALNIAGARLDTLSAFEANDLESAGMRLVYGCVDTQAPAPDMRQTIQARIERAVEQWGAEHLWLSPDCGLRLHSRADAQEILGELADAAQAVRAHPDA
ncbi:MAG TPA: uroporphyrinogen decarboxylase family protein [Ktedonobacterales bacterium]|nr:uroporphyrinogen decarboxylase family protein [Ktedonobacterales bacterium]